MLRTASHISFAVDDVNPARERLKTCQMHEALEQVLGGPVEACSDFTLPVVRQSQVHPLVHAVHVAFSRHLPLVLSPDMIWLTIAQGAANHINANAETLRHRLVAHEGKINLVVRRTDFVPGSPWNGWPEVFEELCQQIQEHVGEEAPTRFVADFSTTGPTEKTVYFITMMDAYRRYFDYVVTCICGIPTITLEGTISDWQEITRRAEALEDLDLHWWTRRLVPICNEFVEAASGQPNRAFWKRIYKPAEAYGTENATGWIAYLFPYLRQGVDRVPTRRNEYLSQKMGELPPGRSFAFDAPGVPLSAFPTGLSSVPLKMIPEEGQVRHQEILGGFTGVSQEQETFRLRPIIGWAVRLADPLDLRIEEIIDKHDARRESGLEDISPLGHFGADLVKFYSQVNGARLFPEGDQCSCRILPIGEMQGLDAPPWREWWRFADLRDGSRLAYQHGRGFMRYRDQDLAPESETPCLIVSRTLSELLETLITKPFPEFKNYGNAGEALDTYIVRGVSRDRRSGMVETPDQVGLGEEELTDYIGTYLPVANQNKLSIEQRDGRLELRGHWGTVPGKSVRLRATGEDQFFGRAVDAGAFSLTVQRDTKRKVTGMTLCFLQAVPPSEDGIPITFGYRKIN